jgi:hypothetical protein
MDFTLKRYKELLQSLQKSGYSFRTFEEFNQYQSGRMVVLRHDVDRLPANAVALAVIENDLNIRASYHFRVRGGETDSEAIKRIVSLGHEVAYHYEDLSEVAKSSTRSEKKGDEIYKKAFGLFLDNLAKLREYYPVKVISMHGSPLSAYDNRLIWRYYSYRDKGIVCEPYFDIDLSGVLYITDTGRRWDGEKTNLRDHGPANIKGKSAGEEIYNSWMVKPKVGSAMYMTDRAQSLQTTYRVKGTSGIIKNLSDSTFPDKVIISTHPQRWTDGIFPWLKELVFQNLKNAAKYILSVIRTVKR